MDIFQYIYFNMYFPHIKCLINWFHVTSLQCTRRLQSSLTLLFVVGSWIGKLSGPDLHSVNQDPISLRQSLCLSVSVSQSLCPLFLSMSVSQSLSLCFPIGLSVSQSLSFYFSVCLPLSQSLSFCFPVGLFVSQSFRSVGHCLH